MDLSKSSATGRPVGRAELLLIMAELLGSGFHGDHDLRFTEDEAERIQALETIEKALGGKRLSTGDIAHLRKLYHSNHFGVEVTKLAFNELKQEKRVEIEQHLATCEDCREHLAFVREFNEAMRGLSGTLRTPNEPCPPLELIKLLEAEELDVRDKETARHLRAHMLWCASCSEVFYILERSRIEENRRLIRESNPS